MQGSHLRWPTPWNGFFGLCAWPRSDSLQGSSHSWRSSPLRPSAQTGSPTQVLDVRLGSPPVAGKDVDLHVEAVNAGAPVSGMVVRFGSREGVFGTSACRVQDPLSGPVGPPFSPGSRVRMTAPHRFRGRGGRKVTVRVDSGDCAASLDSIFQQGTVMPTAPGEPSGALELDPPTLIAPPEARVLPLRLRVAGQPAAASARRRTACPGSRRRAGRSARSVRIARAATLCLLNAKRRRFRLAPFRSNPRLLRAAEEHSRSMVQRGYFSHVEPGGVGLVDRLLKSGYLLRVTRWTVGENIGFGRGSASTPRAMVRAWMASTGHRANILNGAYDEIGLGVVRGVPGNHAGGRHVHDGLRLREAREEWS